MTSTPPNFGPPLSKKGPAPRPPRITIGTPLPYPPGIIPPQTAQFYRPPTAAGLPTAATTVVGNAATGPGGAPVWPSYNPFQYVYSEKAGAFMTKGFEGVWGFTKSGMSSGEKFVYHCFSKISVLSKRWFTHIFLFTVVVLYTVLGALLFQAIESKNAQKEHLITQEEQKDFFEAVRNFVALDDSMTKLQINKVAWEGEFLNILRSHRDVVSEVVNKNLTREEMKQFTNPWTFWNSMFYCGTIYTTIEVPSHLKTFSRQKQIG